MTTTELKEKLIKKLENVTEDYLLEEVLSMLELEEEHNKIFKLSNEQKKAIDKARKQIAEGNYSTDEEVTKEIDVWLNE